MSVLRSVLLAASQNRWMRERATKYSSVKKSVSRFMPGETLQEAIAAAQTLGANGIASVLTHLGENVADANEAQQVTEHYLQVLQKLHAENLPIEISVKPTQLGLDLSLELCESNLRRLFAAENPERTLWIDMEASNYVEPTLTIYRKLLADFANAGICLQAYLHRTTADIDALLPLKPSIRLVKGAYAEPPDLALQNKLAIDQSYLALADKMLHGQMNGAIARAAFATHDTAIIKSITRFASEQGIPKHNIEFQMLYGIQRSEQQRLASGGWRSGILIAYGQYWYPWFVRRLAERPANLWLLARNLFSS
jgi:proline dehydrogenase